MRVVLEGSGRLAQPVSRRESSRRRVAAVLGDLIGRVSVSVPSDPWAALLNIRKESLCEIAAVSLNPLPQPPSAFRSLVHLPSAPFFTLFVE